MEGWTLDGDKELTRVESTIPVEEIKPKKPLPEATNGVILLD